MAQCGGEALSQMGLLEQGCRGRVMTWSTRAMSATGMEATSCQARRMTSKFSDAVTFSYADDGGKMYL
ncbi:hypothetical protein SKAU_G00313310 [Synaphobranchus kaupii]|uniref:Uncharacterized protein n=1 Tax=Synaphobranchus kaupii TaxID=118154 RepID=A0A9Q1ES85_SYNKA|nr:hypothetical protein SKAU_G00313310 [Synaphobranchus kaupii]